LAGIPLPTRSSSPCLNATYGELVVNVISSLAAFLRAILETTLSTAPASVSSTWVTSILQD